MARTTARGRSGAPVVRHLDRPAHEARVGARARRGALRGASLRGGRRRRIARFGRTPRAWARASLELGILTGEAWALQEVGQVKEAIELLLRAREIAERDGHSDLELADVLYRLAVCRYKLSSLSTAIALFDQALTLAEHSGLPCDLLRSEILQRRSRCHRLLRDYAAAHDDVERALELAQDLGDRPRSPTRTSRRRSSRSGRGTTCSRAATRSARRSCTTR